MVIFLIRLQYIINVNKRKHHSSMQLQFQSSSSASYSLLDYSLRVISSFIAFTRCILSIHPFIHPHLWQSLTRRAMQPFTHLCSDQSFLISVLKIFCHSDNSSINRSIIYSKFFKEHEIHPPPPAKSRF